MASPYLFASVVAVGRHQHRAPGPYGIGMLALDLVELLCGVFPFAAADSLPGVVVDGVDRTFDIFGFSLIPGLVAAEQRIERVAARKPETRAEDQGTAEPGVQSALGTSVFRDFQKRPALMPSLTNPGPAHQAIQRKWRRRPKTEPLRQVNDRVIRLVGKQGAQQRVVLGVAGAAALERARSAVHRPAPYRRWHPESCDGRTRCARTASARR